MAQENLAKKVNLRTDEQIIAILHHHPITYVKQFFITAVLILGAFFLMFFLFSIGQIGVALYCALLLTGFFYGAREFYIWYNNIFVITNQRIIDIDQSGFFHKTVSEVSLDKILDICYYVHGFWQTILHLGTIKITEAGASLILRNIKEASKVNQLIADLIREQTGKKIEVKKVKVLTPMVKEQLTEDFLKQDELAVYDDYNLNELLEEYKETFGELKLKKLIVDELEKYEEPASTEVVKGPEVAESQPIKQVPPLEEVRRATEEEAKVPIVNKFKNKRL